MARNLVDNDFNKVNGLVNNQSAISRNNFSSSNVLNVKGVPIKSNCSSVNVCADTPPPPYKETTSNEDIAGVALEFNGGNNDNLDKSSSEYIKSPVPTINSSSISNVRDFGSDTLKMPAQSTQNDRSSLRLQLNGNSCSSKPKLTIQSENIVESEESDSNDDDDENKPVLHVQFHQEKNESSNNEPVKETCPPTPESLSSSSSSSSSSESIDISEVKPPDGGWGWVIVGVSFIINLIADGITFSFGVIYHEFLEYFGEDKSKTAWIGSLFMAMPLLSGPIASFLTDRYGCRKVTIAGSILAATGFLLSSQANSTEVLYITFGGLAGFGLSLCYVASVVIVAYYFDKRRSFATGLAVCGSGIGTFIFAPLIQVLLDEYGWRGTTIILAGLFLNLAVCGALMRDLPWTSYKQKSAARERKERRNLKRKKNYSSADTFSVSNSSNTASALQPIVEVEEPDDSDDAKDKEPDHRLYSSLINLPTYVRNGEKVPAEVLELLSTHKNVYNMLLQNYPYLLTPSRSFSDSGHLHKAHLATKTPLPQSPLAAEIPNMPSPSCQKQDPAYLYWSKRNSTSSTKNNPQKKLQTAYLKDIKIHRLSLTYRGAMLNINRYRLRASSCPDIYRNSMTTIAKGKMEWYAALWDFWDLVVDIIDFSHFLNLKYLLFALSNFLLYTWYDVEYMYLSDHAIGMGFSDKDASILISVIGIVNMFGEIILGWAGDRPWVNASFIYAVCMCFCGAVTGLVPLLDSYWALCIVSGSFGFFIAANYSLTCIILVELITLERFTNAYGLLLLVQGIANLVGPPLAGLISDITGTYDLSFYIAGIFIAVSGLLLMILPASNKYKKFALQRQTSNDNSIEDASFAEMGCCSINNFCCLKNRHSSQNTSPTNHV